jgi:hypothetical protein
MQDYCIITFESTHAAITAEKLLQGLRITVMPTPREVSASCGIALRLGVDELEEACRRLNETSVTVGTPLWYRMSSDRLEMLSF